MGQINTTPPPSSAGSLTKSLERLAPYVLSIVRIMVALLFLEHGLAKLLVSRSSRRRRRSCSASCGFPGRSNSSVARLAAVGLFTRAAAFIMSGEMAVGYFMAHAPQSFFPLINRGDGAILYCFIFLYLFFAGPGPWSLDALIWRRTGQAL